MCVCVCVCVCECVCVYSSHNSESSENFELKQLIMHVKP